MCIESYTWSVHFLLCTAKNTMPLFVHPLEIFFTNAGQCSDGVCCERVELQIYCNVAFLFVTKYSESVPITSEHIVEKLDYNT